MIPSYQEYYQFCFWERTKIKNFQNKWYKKTLDLVQQQQSSDQEGETMGKHDFQGDKQESFPVMCEIESQASQTVEGWEKVGENKNKTNNFISSVLILEVAVHIIVKIGETFGACVSEVKMRFSSGRSNVLICK